MPNEGNWWGSLLCHMQPNSWLHSNPHVTCLYLLGAGAIAFHFFLHTRAYWTSHTPTQGKKGDLPFLRQRALIQSKREDFTTLNLNSIMYLNFLVHLPLYALFTYAATKDMHTTNENEAHGDMRDVGWQSLTYREIIGPTQGVCFRLFRHVCG